MNIRHLGSILCLSVCLLPAQGVEDPEGTSLAARYAATSASFEPNYGQAPAEVEFLSRAAGYTLLLTEKEIAIQTETGVVHMELSGADPQARIAGADRLLGTVQYFRGSDPSAWHTGIPTYAKVNYQKAYPGIDLIFYGNREQLEFDFLLEPGADPGRILLHFPVGNPRIDPNGDVLISSGAGDIRLKKPESYQWVEGVRRPVIGRFIARNKTDIGFEVTGYDPEIDLVIDPAMVYSSYLGPSSNTWGNAVSTTEDPVTGRAYAYVTGKTCATDSGPERNTASDRRRLRCLRHEV